MSNTIQMQKKMISKKSATNRTKNSNFDQNRFDHGKKRAIISHLILHQHSPKQRKSIQKNGNNQHKT